MYWLQSRYYDPETGRFINADVPGMDTMALFTGDFLSTNLFAYCGNNPVMNVDPSGMLYISFATMGKILLIIGINPIAATLIGMGIAKITSIITAKVALLGAKIGAALGPVGSFAFSVLLGVIGYSIGKQLATAIINAALQKKGGIDISFKYTWFGWAIWYKYCS